MLGEGAAATYWACAGMACPNTVDTWLLQSEPDTGISSLRHCSQEQNNLLFLLMAGLKLGLPSLTLSLECLVRAIDCSSSSQAHSFPCVRTPGPLVHLVRHFDLPPSPHPVSWRVCPAGSPVGRSPPTAKMFTRPGEAIKTLSSHGTESFGEGFTVPWQSGRAACAAK